MRHFAGWLELKGYNQQSASRIPPNLALDLIGAYLTWVREGNVLPSNSKGPLSEQSLRNYVNSAANCITNITGTPCIVLDPTTLQQKRVCMHPYIKEQLAQRAAWSQPKPRKAPFTLEMFQALYKYLRAQPDGLDCFLTKEYAVFDWTRLGLFTGSRVSEYAQSRLAKSVRFNKIPAIEDAGIWAGQALAFLRVDFSFYTDEHRAISPSDLHQTFLQGNVASVHIRFRFDKSPRNFSIRKFRSTNDPILNPVAAAVSCIHRADLLGIPDWEPIGAFGSVSSRSFLRDYHITRVMQKSCLWAYPDPTHEMRLQIKCIVPHSNRITAAVALKLGGAADEEIAFRLRWHVSSVPTYLRECFHQVGAIIEQALTGAYRTSF
jgi:hypothetical protein